MASKEQFLTALAEAKPRISFAELLLLLHANRYTGPITLHCFSGTPTSCELPRDPVQIRLDGPVVVDTTGLLDHTSR